MYPVGVLFGFGKRAYEKDWDQLICAKALTRRRQLRSSRHLPSRRKVQIQKEYLLGTSSSCLLGPFNRPFRDRTADLHNQLLFTAGMTLLDSIDSILMLYSYTGFAEHRFRIFEPARENDGPEDHMTSAYREAAATSVSAAQLPRSRGSHDDETERCPLSGVPPALGEQNGVSQEDKKQPVEVQVEETDARITEIRKEAQRELMVKRNMMSGLSILLTLMSIVVAFRCEFRRGWLLRDSLDGLIGCQHITNHDYGIDRGKVQHVQRGGRKRQQGFGRRLVEILGGGIPGRFVLLIEHALTRATGKRQLWIYRRWHRW
jgi:hypothetical protein